MTLSLSSPALIVVDVQAGTLPNAVSVPADEVVERIATIVARFHAAGHPVFFVASTGAPAGLTDYGPGGRVWPDGFDELDPRLGRNDEDVVLRRAGWSAFAGTDLADRLETHSTREVVTVGLATTFGVESTARAASDLGFDVVVVRNAVSDPDSAGHDRTLGRVIPALGRVVETADLAP